MHEKCIDHEGRREIGFIPTWGLISWLKMRGDQLGVGVRMTNAGIGIYILLLMRGLVFG